MFLIGALSGYFVYSRPDVGYLLLCGALPAGLLLGLVLSGLDTVLRPLDTWLAQSLGTMLAGFVLVFLYIITYTFSFFLIVSFPLGLILNRDGANLALSQDFDLYVVSFAVLASLLKLLCRGRFTTEQAGRSCSPLR